MEQMCSSVSVWVPNVWSGGRSKAVVCLWNLVSDWTALSGLTQSGCLTLQRLDTPGLWGYPGEPPILLEEKRKGNGRRDYEWGAKNGDSNWDVK